MSSFLPILKFRITEYSIYGRNFHVTNESGLMRVDCIPQATYSEGIPMGLNPGPLAHQARTLAAGTKAQLEHHADALILTILLRGDLPVFTVHEHSAGCPPASWTVCRQYYNNMDNIKLNM